MLVAKLFSKIYKKGGIVLIDHSRTKVYLWKSKS